MSYEIQPNYEAEARIHNEQETKPPQKSHGCLVVIATMVIVAVINFIIIGIFVKPEATSEDINVRVGEVSILAVNIVITPKVNIDDFKIEINIILSILYVNRSVMSKKGNNIIYLSQR